MIQAKVIADSLAPSGDRLTTLEVIMPRYILAEFNTHRMLSKNSASSRAIPFNKMVKNVEVNPFIPYAWQKDHKGMQGSDYLTNSDDVKFNESLWLQARDNAVEQAIVLNDVGGVTKQLCNRLLEPFMYHKVLISATEWENFFNLRCPKYVVTELNGKVVTYKSRKEVINFYKANSEYKVHYNYAIGYTDLEWLKLNKGQADIHMMFLAEAIYDAMNESTPIKLKEGEWHIPYGDNMELDMLETLLIKANYGWKSSNQETEGGWLLKGGEEAYYKEIENLKAKISIARCARLSYQTLGDNPVIDYEKDLELYEVLSKSGHWSPFEHVAKVMTGDEYRSNIKGKLNLINDRQFQTEFSSKTGYTPLSGACEEKALGWSRNYKGFIQYREYVDND